MIKSKKWKNTAILLGFFVGDGFLFLFLFCVAVPHYAMVSQLNCFLSIYSSSRYSLSLLMLYLSRSAAVGWKLQKFCNSCTVPMAIPLSHLPSAFSIFLFVWNIPGLYVLINIFQMLLSPIQTLRTWLFVCCYVCRVNSRQEWAVSPQSQCLWQAERLCKDAD